LAFLTRTLNFVFRTNRASSKATRLFLMEWWKQHQSNLLSHLARILWW